MDWTRPVDIYCERLAPGFWAEPVNALTNAAFLAAAAWAYAYARRRNQADATITALVALLAAIGIGSFLFHTFATAWAALADVIPIWTFAATALIAALHRFFRIRPAISLLGLLTTAAAATLLVRALPTLPSFNGSLTYAPALAALAACAFALHRTRHPSAAPITTATALLTASLALRTADQAACAAFPLGTHFVWHLLNSAVLALVIKGLVDGKRA